MSKIRILQYPQDLDLLRRTGIEVTTFDENFKKTVADMFETLYASDGCAALAATQLDIPNAPYVTVIDFSPEKNKPLCLVNAKITEFSEGQDLLREGCMSVNSRKGKSITSGIERSINITVEAQDEDGKKTILHESGFMARVIQHELDHLQGKLYIDYLTGLRRKTIERKILS
ncbi:MAG: peptide deformylase [Legionellales bacterium]|jgi:peptide deformylase|nr:peptide deformylase [Legionellales bacterium]